MEKPEKEVKQKIINATIDLIKKYGDVSRITVREIAFTAGVGVGLINYHFQTKENLINQCTLDLIRHSIGQLGAKNHDSAMAPIDKLKLLANGIASFMAMNPGVSRISIVKDYASPEPADNSAQVIQMLAPIARDICGEGESGADHFLRLHTLVSAIEAAFLRKDALMTAFGIDFDDHEQRAHLVDFCIDQIFS